MNKKLKHERSKAKRLERRKKRLEKKKSRIPKKVDIVQDSSNFSKSAFIPPSDDKSEAQVTKVLKTFDTNAWKPNE